MPADDDTFVPEEPVRVELGDELDLHAFPPREARELVRDYVDHAAARGWPVVRIIHGRGIGAVREIVRRALSGHPHVESFATPTDRGGWGATVVRVRPAPVVVRPLSPHDSLELLTELLHRAYAPLAARGMRFVASHQDVATTRRRCEEGETWIAEIAGHLAGTVTLYAPAACHGSPWYDRPDVASFGQWAVDPPFQARGVGRLLLERVEQRALELGARHLALDTSEHAAELIATYERRGFRFVEHADWRSTNYRSVILSKSLR